MTATRTPRALVRMIARELATRPAGDLFEDGADDEHTGWLAVGVEPMDCENTAGVRPCPFAECPHNMLLDYVPTDRPEPNLAITRARLPIFGQEPQRGRRSELPPLRRPAKERRFIDDAVQRLWELPDTCAREVTLRRDASELDGNGLMMIRRIAAHLGAEEDEVGLALDAALCIVRGAAIAAGADPDDRRAIAIALLQVLGIER